MFKMYYALIKVDIGADSTIITGGDRFIGRRGDASVSDTAQDNLNDKISLIFLMITASSDCMTTCRRICTCDIRELDIV